MSKRKFIPADGYILVRRKEVEEVTKSGLYIPDAARVPQTEALVVTSNDSKYPEGTTVVLVNRYAGEPMRMNGEELFIVHSDGEHSQVLGVIK